MVNYERYWSGEESPFVNDRKKLVTIETGVKLAVSQLNAALWNLDSVYPCEEKWELMHHLYTAVESCDRSLKLVFDKQADLLEKSDPKKSCLDMVPMSE